MTEASFKDIGLVLSLDETDGFLPDLVASLPTIRTGAGRLHLFHIIPSLALSGHMQEMVHSLQSPHFGLEDRLKKIMLQQWSQRYPELAAQGSLLADVREGHPLQLMLQLCAEHSVDLLVSATIPGDMASGLAAKRLARHAKQALLFLPAGTSALELDHPVVPFDFSEHSVKAVRAMLRWADEMGKPSKSVKALYVVDYPPTKDYLTRHYGLLTSDWKERLARRFREQMAMAGIDPDRLDFLAVKNDRFDVAATLRAYWQASGTDFICMGALGHSSLEHLFLGSVTEALVSDPLDIPILLIRS
jgi:nucleotide-binding universal stress UspA family protein